MSTVALLVVGGLVGAFLAGTDVGNKFWAVVTHGCVLVCCAAVVVVCLAWWVGLVEVVSAHW